MQDGVTGRVVPPRSPEALADAILDLLGDPEGARRLAEAGHAVAVERFAPDVLVRAVEHEYRQVMR